MTCKMCKERGQTWEGDKPRCAFESGVFDEDNWQCATINALRDLVYEGQSPMPPRVDYRYCEDQKYATVCIDGIEGADGALALWVSWYKNRGGTDQAWLLYDDGAPAKPTERQVLAILEATQA